MNTNIVITTYNARVKMGHLMMQSPVVYTVVTKLVSNWISSLKATKCSRDLFNNLLTAVLVKHEYYLIGFLRLVLVDQIWPLQLEKWPSTMCASCHNSHNCLSDQLIGWGLSYFLQYFKQLLGWVQNLCEQGQTKEQMRHHLIDASSIFLSI